MQTPLVFPLGKLYPSLPRFPPVSTIVLGLLHFNCLIIQSMELYIGYGCHWSKLWSSFAACVIESWGLQWFWSFFRNHGMPLKRLLKFRFIIEFGSSWLVKKNGWWPIDFSNNKFIGKKFPILLSNLQVPVCWVWPLSTICLSYPISSKKNK